MAATQRNSNGSMGRLASYLAFSQLLPLITIPKSTKATPLIMAPFTMLFPHSWPFCQSHHSQTFLLLWMHHDLSTRTPFNEDPILLIAWLQNCPCINQHRTPANQFQGWNWCLSCCCLFSGCLSPQCPCQIPTLSPYIKSSYFSASPHTYHSCNTILPFNKCCGFSITPHFLRFWSNTTVATTMQQELHNALPMQYLCNAHTMRMQWWLGKEQWLCKEWPLCNEWLWHSQQLQCDEWWTMM